MFYYIFRAWMLELQSNILRFFIWERNNGITVKNGEWNEWIFAWKIKYSQSVTLCHSPAVVVANCSSVHVPCLVKLLFDVCQQATRLQVLNHPWVRSCLYFVDPTNSTCTHSHIQEHQGLVHPFSFSSLLLVLHQSHLVFPPPPPTPNAQTATNRSLFLAHVRGACVCIHMMDEGDVSHLSRKEDGGEGSWVWRGGQEVGSWARTHGWGVVVVAAATTWV